MNKIICLVLLAVSLLVISNEVFAQDNNQPKVGISALLQDTQLDILLPIWAGSKFVIAPGISFVSTDARQDFGLGLAFRIYVRKDKAAPYFGVRFAALIFSPEFAQTTTDIIAGILAGGEYFLDKHFSFGVEAQLNSSFSDEQSNRFGNPGGVNINTGSAIFATFYF